MTVSFVPGQMREGLLAARLAKVVEAPYSTVRRFRVRRLPERLAEILCAEAEVEPGGPGRAGWGGEKCSALTAALRIG